MAYELRALNAQDGCSSLGLGDATLTPLKTCLRKEAKKLHQDNLAKTFVLVEKGNTRVWAYITTLCTQVSVQQFDPSQLVEGFHNIDFPAIKLARLDVDVDLQGQGVGSQLVDFVMGLATVHVMPHTGCRFLVVDAKANSVAIYERKGFSKIGQATDGQRSLTTMFYDLHRLHTT